MITRNRSGSSLRDPRPGKWERLRAGTRVAYADEPLRVVVYRMAERAYADAGV